MHSPSGRADRSQCLWTWYLDQARQRQLENRRSPSWSVQLAEYQVAMQPLIPELDRISSDRAAWNAIGTARDLPAVVEPFSRGCAG